MEGRPGQVKQSFTGKVTMGLGLPVSTAKEIVRAHSVFVTTVPDFDLMECYQMSLSLGAMFRSPRGLESGLEYI